MVQENYTNFASSVLVSPSPFSINATNFTITGGQGSLYPLANFPVTMDTEIMLITSRAADTFTVGMRGFDGSAAATHSVGAVVQQCSIAYSYNHLWDNVADTFLPDVPPVQLSISPSSYDHEFEVGGNGSWQLYPNSGFPTDTVFSIGTPLKSMLLLHRSSSDSALYTAYVPFTQSAPWVATCKLSHSVSLSVPGGTAEAHFFVSDQTNPTSSIDGGNRIRIDSILLPNQSGTYNGLSILASTAHVVRMLRDVSGSGTQIASFIPLTIGVPYYYRIACASGGVYTTYIGDGVTFWYIGTYTTTFSPQSLGFAFYTSNTGFAQTAAVDWVRVVTATFPTYYGA